MGILFWKGVGWLVPVIIMASFSLTEWTVNLILGNDYFNYHHWPRYIAVLVGSILIGLLAWYFNYHKRDAIIDNASNVVVKPGQHNFIYIPMQYWVLIFPLLAFLVFKSDLRSEKIDDAYIITPKIGDIYLINKAYMKVNFSGLDKYCSMKVMSFDNKEISFVLSDDCYKKIMYPKNDYKTGSMKKSGYFDENLVRYTKKELIRLRTGTGIIEIKRTLSMRDKVSS